MMGGGAKGRDAARRREARKRERERENDAAREYRASVTPKARIGGFSVRRGIDGDLVAGNSPRLTPSLSSSPPSRRRGALRLSPVPPSLLVLFLVALPRRSSSDIAHCRVLPFSTLPPAPRGGVIVPCTLPNNYTLPPPSCECADTSDVHRPRRTSRKRRNRVSVEPLPIFSFSLSSLLSLFLSRFALCPYRVHLVQNLSHSSLRVP